MAQSQAKSLSFAIPHSVKNWLPRAAAFVTLLVACAAYLWSFFQPQLPFDPFIYRLVGFAYLAAAVWIMAARLHQPGAIQFILFLAAFALAANLPLVLSGAPVLYAVWVFSLALAGACLLDLAFSFPAADAIARRYPLLRLAGYVTGVLLAGFAVIQRAAMASAGVFVGAAQFLAGFAVLAFLLSAAWMTARRSRQALPEERLQVWLVLIAAGLAFVPLTIWFFAFMLSSEFAFSAYLLLPSLLFPLAATFALQRPQRLIFNQVVSQASLFGLLAVLVAGGYALLVAGLGLLFNTALEPSSPILAGFAIFLVALAVNPLRARLSAAIDSLLFRGERAYTERVQTFSGELSDLVSLPEIVASLHLTIQNSLAPRTLQIFIHDPLSAQYGAAQAGTAPASDLRFTATSPLVHALAGHKAPVFLKDLQQAAHLQPENARLVLLGAQLFAPLRGRNHLTGWCALGERNSGEPYSTRDMAFLDSLCDQAALALERAQVIANLESRIRETTVLGRVAQGVNITITFDDMLELIYAQTMQIIPAEGYHLSLVNRDSGELVEVFHVEGDERFREFENKLPEGGHSLELEVVRQRQPILAEDYARECQRRGILPQRSNIYAWMSVPLNAGAETIGALSLSRSGSTSAFSQEQLALLQSIADQAAGAIIKSRLLQESERRARQLATLNEVTRQLTSTLEPEPLLNNILLSAVEILNCEAGSLLQVDETTGELVFRVTTGPVASNLAGRRLPPEAGVVGKAVKTRLPVIVNDVQKSPDWFQKPDELTGFTTHSLMVVPLQVKERVTGVLEVVNKRDGSIFNQDDLELLSAFAAQAAVAVENVRLFTSTDQALASRVEELSVMQRIDRELNTSLDVKLAMQITLEWAMRQAGTSAGLVGVIQEKGVKVMASQGYETELNVYQDALLPVTAFSLQAVIESGVPRIVAVPDDGGITPLLQNATYQLVLPIRRETTTIGLLFMESLAQEPISEEMLAFLERLADHAAVAIANAQLYTAVQAANVAKSEFVSFVAHELKNPMTSIKGFTELLAAGAVGQVNEAQANFLQTIRSNIERMNTLVSDLNDLSKIEAGRLRLEFKAFPISAVVDDAVRSLRRQVDEKGQKLVLAFPADLPPVWADRMRVSQVVINLISNAHKYTSQAGQITVGAEACQNRWDESGPQQVLHLWVQDTGIGISPEDQKKIFQKFFRADDPKTREVAGTGLGLNITKALVEMQGGKIWFESVFRQGTTFHITLPVAEQ